MSLVWSIYNGYRWLLSLFSKLIESIYKLKIKFSNFLPLLIVTFFILIFAINLNVKKDDKKIDQLKSPLINQNIPKNLLDFFKKMKLLSLKMFTMNFML